MKNLFLICLFITLCLTSCRLSNIEKSEDGYYHYDYCIGVKGKKSLLLSKFDSVSSEEQFTVSGRVVTLSDREVVPETVVTINYANHQEAQVTDSLGQFYFKIPKEQEQWKIKARFVIFSTFESEMTTNKNTYLEIGMGEASGFVSFDIKSKRRFFNWQLKRRARKLSKR